MTKRKAIRPLFGAMHLKANDATLASQGIQLHAYPSAFAVKTLIAGADALHPSLGVEALIIATKARGRVGLSVGEYQALQHVMSEFARVRNARSSKPSASGAQKQQDEMEEMREQLARQMRICGPVDGHVSSEFRQQ